MPDPSRPTGYRSPESVLAEARRMAAEIRRQAERDALALRRDAAEWASTTRREAELYRDQVLGELRALAELAPAANGASSEAGHPLTGQTEVDVDDIGLDLVFEDPSGTAAASRPLDDALTVEPFEDPSGVQFVPAAAEARAEVDSGLDAAPDHEPAGEPDDVPEPIIGAPTPLPEPEPAYEPEPVVAVPRARALGAVIDLRAEEGARRARRRVEPVVEDVPAERAGEPARAPSDLVGAGSYVVGHPRPPVETSLETKVHDVVRHTIRRTFHRRFG